MTTFSPATTTAKVFRFAYINITLVWNYVLVCMPFFSVFKYLQWVTMSQGQFDARLRIMTFHYLYLFFLSQLIFPIFCCVSENNAFTMGAYSWQDWRWENWNISAVLCRKELRLAEPFLGHPRYQLLIRIKRLKSGCLKKRKWKNPAN